MPGRRLGIQTHMGMAVARRSTTITITSPTASQSVSGTIIVKGTTTTTGVEVSVDGGTYRPANLHSGKWMSTWDTNTLSAGAHTFTARSTQTGDTVAVSVTVSSVATLAGLQLDRFGLNFTDPTNKNKYAVINTTVDLLTSDPSLPGLLGLYRDMKAVDPAGSSDFSLPKSEADANGWYCHLKSNPATIYTMGDGNRMLNIGLSAVRDRWISYNLTTYFTPRPWIKGIIIDNCNPSTTYRSGSDPDFYPNEYPTYATWRAALLGMFQYCCQALLDAGLYVICNMTGLIEALPGGPGGNEFSSATTAWWTDMAPYMSAGNLEDPMVSANDRLFRVSGPPGSAPDNFDLVRAMHPFANGLGLDFHVAGIFGKKGPTTTGASDGEGVIYERVCWLLDWNGRSGCVKDSDALPDPWVGTPTWVQSAGQPTGAAVEELTDVWTRGFSGGAITKVYANTRQYGGADVSIDGHTLTCPSALIV